MSAPLLVARAQATDQTGAGHAMRCLGVLQEWVKAGGQAELWGNIEIDFVRRRAENMKVPIVAMPGANVSLLLVDVYDDVERTALGQVGCGETVTCPPCPHPEGVLLTDPDFNPYDSVS